jgi:predicted small secreted protein
MRNVILITGLLLTALSMSACNTAEGFGKDMENAGKSIQKKV